MLSNMLNDLAEAMKALEGKKVLQSAYSMGEWHYGPGFATFYFCAYCNALQVFQGR